MADPEYEQHDPSAARCRAEPALLNLPAGVPVEVTEQVLRELAPLS